MEMARQSGELEQLVMRLVAVNLGALRSLARERGRQPPCLSEGDRLTAIKARAVPPARCGPDMPAAPARGPMVAFAPVAMHPTADGYAQSHDGYRGRDAARAADVFDRMCLQAQRRGGVAPFTASQIAAGRGYGALVERHAARGLRGFSAETRGGGGGRAGGGGGGYIDAVLAEGQLIALLRAAIGDDMALTVQRGPGGQRVGIPARVLVDAVCLHQQPVSAVLRRYGWSIQGTTRARAQAALARALDRMAGNAGPSRRKGLDA